MNLGELPFLTIITGIIIAVLILTLVDGIFYQPEDMKGIIVDKHYKAERNSIGTGTAITSNGVGIVTTTEVDPEEFLVMTKDVTGKIVTVKCSPELYYKKEFGDTIYFNANKGLITDIIWSYKGVK